MINNILSKIDKANKIEEVKLASQKVELALMDDIKAAVGKYKALDDASKAALNKSKNALIAYSDSVRVALQNAKNGVDLIAELDKKSKELGIADAGLDGYKKELQGKLTEYNALFKKVDAIYKSL
jgi:hypothetical protein